MGGCNHNREGYNDDAGDHDCEFCTKVCHSFPILEVLSFFRRCPIRIAKEREDGWGMKHESICINEARFLQVMKRRPGMSDFAASHPDRLWENMRNSIEFHNLDYVEMDMLDPEEREYVESTYKSYKERMLEKGTSNPNLLVVVLCQDTIKMMLELGFRLGGTITKKDLLSSRAIQRDVKQYDLDPNDRFVMKKYLRDWLESFGVAIKEDDFVVVDDNKDEFLRLFRLRSDPFDPEYE